MRLIDADELKKNWTGIDTPVGYRKVVDLEVIDNAPTVRLEYVPNYANCESVAMVRVRPQGKWISDYRTCKCSVCNFTTVIDTYNFCPNCGADMRGEEE